MLCNACITRYIRFGFSRHLELLGYLSGEHHYCDSRITYKPSGNAFGRETTIGHQSYLESGPSRSLDFGMFGEPSPHLPCASTNPFFFAGAAQTIVNDLVTIWRGAALFPERRWPIMLALVFCTASLGMFKTIFRYMMPLFTDAPLMAIQQHPSLKWDFRLGRRYLAIRALTLTLWFPSSMLRALFFLSRQTLL